MVWVLQNKITSSHPRSAIRTLILIRLCPRSLPIRRRRLGRLPRTHPVSRRRARGRCWWPIRAAPVNNSLVSRAHVFVKVHRFVHLVSLRLLVIEPTLEEFGVVLCKDLIALLDLTELELKRVDLIVKNLSKGHHEPRQRRRLGCLLVLCDPSPS